MKQKDKFSSIIIDGFSTMNNLETNQIGIAFESEGLQGALIFTRAQAISLLKGLEKSLDRLKERRSKLD